MRGYSALAVLPKALSLPLRKRIATGTRAAQSELRAIVQSLVAVYVAKAAPRTLRAYEAIIALLAVVNSLSIIKNTIPFVLVYCPERAFLINFSIRR